MAAENVFIILYTVEMMVKIFGLGFLFGPNAYLKESWNILDFVIVVTSYTSYFESAAEDGAAASSSFSLSGLRAFRVTRPLKTISSIKGLKVLMQALFQAMPLLYNTVGILCFFFLIFAIAGVNLMSGKLKNRCVSIQTGMELEDGDSPRFCEGIGCPGGYFCGKTNANPNYGVTNFDNVMYSVLCVFQSVTLEGWSDIQKDL